MTNKIEQLEDEVIILGGIDEIEDRFTESKAIIDIVDFFHQELEVDSEGIKFLDRYISFNNTKTVKIDVISESVSSSKFKVMLYTDRGYASHSSFDTYELFNFEVKPYEVASFINSGVGRKYLSKRLMEKIA